MNNGAKILAIEFMISMGVVSWAPIKQGYYPWPPALIRTCVAYAILSLVSVIDDKMAALLGGGFLLAQLVLSFSKVPPAPAGKPPAFSDYIYTNLSNDPSFRLYGLKFDGTVGNQ